MSVLWELKNFAPSIFGQLLISFPHFEQKNQKMLSSSSISHLHVIKNCDNRGILKNERGNSAFKRPPRLLHPKRKVNNQATPITHKFVFSKFLSKMNGAAAQLIKQLKKIVHYMYIDWRFKRGAFFPKNPLSYIFLHTFFFLKKLSFCYSTTFFE